MSHSLIDQSVLPDDWDDFGRELRYSLGLYRAKVPVCTMEDIGLAWVEEKTKPELWSYIEGANARVNAYLSDFDKPIIRDGKQYCTCGRMVSGFFSILTWSLRYGEAYCTNCYRPARIYHKIILDPTKPEDEWIKFSRGLLYRRYA